MRRLMKANKVLEYSVVHVNNVQGARDLAKRMTTLIGKPPEYIMETSSIIAIGAGEGAVALSYILEEEV